MNGNDSNFEKINAHIEAADLSAFDIDDLTRIDVVEKLRNIGDLSRSLRISQAFFYSNK